MFVFLYFFFCFFIIIFSFHEFGRKRNINSGNKFFNEILNEKYMKIIEILDESPQNAQINLKEEIQNVLMTPKKKYMFE